MPDAPTQTPPMPPDEFARRMTLAFEDECPEGGHIEADRLMCELLTSLGYGVGVETFRSARKWYA